MPSSRRRQSLQALGIDAYRLRDAPAIPEPVQVQERAPRYVAPPAAEVRAPAPALAVAGVKAAPGPAAPITPITPIVPIALPALPADWAGLKALVKDCPRCKLCATRTQTVFGVGAENAPLMVVGEGPGADEDAQGEPFVGRAGKLLDEMLRAIGRSRRDNVYIANVVKCRPPGNREPEPDEVEACRPYLDQQIRLVKPRLIVALGKTAAQRLLQSDAPLSRLRGSIHSYGPEQTPLFITYHPAYLLRSPREKAKSWEDLKKIHRFLAGAPP